MSETRHIIDQVDVLRHGFEPNEPLRDVLASMTRDGSSFHIRGTELRKVHVPTVNAPEYRSQKAAADALLREKASSIHIGVGDTLDIKVLKSQQRGGVALRLVMKPLFQSFEQAALLRETLDTVKVGSRAHTPGFQATRLLVQLPFSQLDRDWDVVRAKVHAAQRAFQDPDKQRLFQVTPESQLVREQEELILPRYYTGDDVDGEQAS